ncbi:hypothetical protein K1T71_009384 [Dendrolimus kikuchii]|uniref:Uncharacterized protein n=1 Tax=Dendrolimus kikuchii TaxID=765133 RepID=A0ACC1CUP2_9NEOP|nr:hypothetical protein K1T71_009384 [Dendrolimus kikuchii]
MVEWQNRLAHPSAGHRTVEAVRPVLPKWIDRRHGTLTFRQTQVLTGHGCFGRYLCQIGRESSSECQHCSASVEDTALHTLQECPAWEEERLVLGATIGNDLSLPAVVQAMVGGQPEWDAVASFCEAVMSAKEAAERERERAAVLLSRRNNRSRRRRNTDLRPP